MGIGEMDGQDPWALAIGLACISGRNRVAARRDPALAGLLKVAERAHRDAEHAIADAMADLMLGERPKPRGEEASGALSAGEGRQAGETGKG